MRCISSPPLRLRTTAGRARARRRRRCSSRCIGRGGASLRVTVRRGGIGAHGGCRGLASWLRPCENLLRTGAARCPGRPAGRACGAMAARGGSGAVSSEQGTAGGARENTQCRPSRSSSLPRWCSASSSSSCCRAGGGRATPRRAISAHRPAARATMAMIHPNRPAPQCR
jgi:hypothetical protein